jgi:hypothetical protein
MTELAISDDVIFVVGTGRCGSTALSRMLSEHPEVLSMSEFIGAMFFSTENINLMSYMDGRELWRMISSANPFIDSALRAGLDLPEIVYPHGRGRFSPVTGIPRICQTVLPTITDDPDALYDRLAAEVPRWPNRDAAGHCLALFDFLARGLGRRMVVERTGISLMYAQTLREMFPRARFVHMYRDGPDCALSMSRHPIYRSFALLRAAAVEEGLPWPSPVRVIMASLPQRFTGLLTPPYDLERFMAYPIPLTWFGDLWSYTTTTGIAALADMPGESWMSVRYEDLVSAPEAELGRLAEFAGFRASPEWLSLARRLIHERSTGTARARLDPDALRDLQQACAPGAEAIQSLPRTTRAGTA